MAWIEIDEARRRLREWAGRLEEDRRSLAALYDAIEPSEQETSAEDVHELDVPNEIRTVLAVTAEELGRLSGRMEEAARYQAEPRPEGGSGPSGPTYTVCGSLFLTLLWLGWAGRHGSAA